MLASHALVLLALISSLDHLLSIQALSPECSDGFSFATNVVASNITQCKKLRALHAELGWSYYNTTPNVTVDVIFAARPPPGSYGGWVAWGVNPGSRAQMIGTRALIAFHQPNGTPTVLTYNVTSENKRYCKLQPSAVEFRTDNMRAGFSDGMLWLSARLSLPPAVYNVSRLNHVWQVGSRVDGDVPRPHAMSLQNLDSREVIDLIDGHSFGSTRDRLRIAHGVLGVIGWGFLMPVGVIIARYFRGSPFKIARWFPMHVVVQLAAYWIGTTAWAIGLSLQTNSRRYKAFLNHKIIGITIFCLASLQMVALWLKPKKMDKYRKYWEIYHHFMGYTLVTLTIVNIFKGFHILQPPPQWRWAYIGILISLCCTAVVLEISIWVAAYVKPRWNKDNKSQIAQQ